MPKIIENVREKLIEEARRQVAEQGYAKTTIRSIAGACGLATGTVYNYFPSKDVLFAAFMLADWEKCLNAMKTCATEDVRGFLGHVCGCLREYIESHSGLLFDKDASAPFAAAFPERHALLRSQIAGVIAPVCRGRDPFFAEFVAESLLSWTSAGKSFDEQYSVLGLLFDR